MANAIIFLFGYKILQTDITYAAEIMNICMREKLVYRRQRTEEDRFIFECDLRTASKLAAICTARGIPLTQRAEKGIPDLLGRYRHRYGFFIGIVIFFAVIAMSGTVIWDIEIDGANRLRQSEVTDQLNACGLHIGSRIKDIDIDSLQNRVTIYSDDISWISVNIIGTVAHVEIRETQIKDGENEYEAANLVADADGRIELFEEVRGNIVTMIGDHVRRGELLVSGIYDSETMGYRYTCAHGRVLARTKNDFHIEIPLKYEKKVYTGNVSTEKHLVFFDKEIKIYSSTGNLYDTCDTIDTVEYLNVLGGGSLPFGVRTVKHMEYASETAERSEQSAAQLAMYTLRCKEAELDPKAELISREYTSEISEDVFVLDCTSYLIRNIARQVEIPIVKSREP